MQPSPLQLLQCDFETVNVTANPDFNRARQDTAFAVPPQALRMSSATAVRDLECGDGWADYAIRFQLKFEPQESDTSPYRGELLLQAIVRMHGGATALERKQLAVVNGVSLIYGVARDMVCTVTSRSSHGQMLLPTLNFRALAQQVAADEASNNPCSSPADAPAPTTKRKPTRRKPQST